MIGIFKKKPEPELESSQLAEMNSNIRKQLNQIETVLTRILTEQIGAADILRHEAAMQEAVLTKMAKFFDVQVKWTEKQVELTESLKPTEDDLKF